MQYRNDKKSGNKLSVLGMGCMRFTRGISGIDFAKAEKLILRAIDEGVNYFDTAYLYSGSEELLGKVIERNDIRSKIYIATKLPIAKCNSTEDLDKYFTTQLDALKTDYIDYYLMHNINNLAQWEELCALGIEDWIAEKKAAGQIHRIGFSFHGPHGEFMKILNAYPWELCQIQYNYANENYQAGVSGLKEIAKREIPAVIMEPLLGGKLVKGLSPAAVKVFSEIAPNRSPAEWGLRWVWDQPEVTVILSGMNEEEQLTDNVAAAEISLPGCVSDAEREAYAKVLEIFKSTDKVPCTGCGYCMPCPQGVNIPGCFAAYNARYTHGLVSAFTMYITGTAANRTGRAMASNCIKCGLCEKHCPQEIEIRKSLGDVKKRMEPLLIRIALHFMRKGNLK